LEIQAVLEQFQSVFATPSGAPSRRVCDHTIPLIQGASPVFSRLYTYAPAMKDETEK
jgi:hypothetical protein